MLTIESLRCEYLKAPLGIDAAKPRLSWRIADFRMPNDEFGAGKSSIGNPQSEMPRGVRQTAYQLLVASSPERLAKDQGDLWDSGKVESDQSILVEYQGPSVRAGKPLESRMQCYWKVRVWASTSLDSEASQYRRGYDASADRRPAVLSALPSATAEAGSLLERTPRASEKGDQEIAKLTPSSWSQPSMWTMGLLRPEDWGAARWIQWTPPPSEFPVAADGTAVEVRDLCPWLRKSFELATAPERALVRLNISGYAELYINGRKVGDDVLTPAIANPEHRTFYVTYDVTKFLRQGPNVMGIWLGRGWARELPLVRAELEARVAGQDVLVVTDESWTGCESPYRHIGKWHWSNFGGERVDARRQRPDWCQPGAAGAGWTPVTVVAGPAVPAVAQPVPLNRLGPGIPAVTVKRLDAKRQVLDFGVAVSGWLRLALPRLEPGQIVKLSFADAESTYTKEGPGGYQTFNQVSEFVSAGQPGEVFEHKFNYAAFQYVVVEGLAADLAPVAATAHLIETDLEPAGGFACSNDLLNRIHGLTRWTLRCLDLGGYVVDCPHRERLGYGGDGQVAVEGFMRGFRADAFYRKWLADWSLRQKPEGVLPNVAPCDDGGGGPGWPGFVAAVTWRHYLHYGDRQVVAENFPVIRRYAEWLETKCQDDILRQYGSKWTFIGDWVPPERGMDTENWPSQRAAELFNNAYRIYHWRLLARLAEVLGDEAEVRRCEERLAVIRAAVHRAFYDPVQGHYGVDEQAYYVMPLMTGIVPAELRPAVLEKLERNILGKNRGHLDTGLFATYFMMEYLREIGRSDLVFTMFSQDTYPGWGHMLAQGASTCWEQWNGHFSRIHNCFTSADNWLYQGPGGILPDPAGPGFKKIIIKPAVVGGLQWVNCHHDSPHGRIVCNWQREAGGVTLDVTIPANTTATVVFPAESPAQVTESGLPVAGAAGVRDVRVEPGQTVVEVGSGSYIFGFPLTLEEERKSHALLTS